MSVRLTDIIDLPLLQTMLEGLWRANGIPLGLIDARGEVLIATGWQKLCTEYHLRHPELGPRCVLNRLPAPESAAADIPREIVCSNGLIDIVLPIWAEQTYLGLIFLGQFLDRPPDRDHGRRFAVRYGLDPESYLAQLDEVPILSREQIDHFLGFFAALIRLLTETGLRKLRGEQARQALAESEETFRSLFDNANDGIVIAAADGRILAANPAICRLLGRSSEGILQETLYDLADTDVSGQLSGRIDEIREQGSAIFETLLRRVDGIPVPVEISSRLIQYRERVALLNIVHDLTQRRQAEQSLRESEERFRSIVQATPLGIHMYRCEPDGRLIFIGANPAADEILGVDNSRFVGKELLEAFPSLAGTSVPESYWQICLTGEPWQTEQVTYADGNITGAFEVHAFRTGPQRMASIFMDIGERMRSVEAIRSREAMLRGILAAVADALVVISQDGCLLAANPVALELLGGETQVIVGRPIAGKLVGPQFLDRVDQVIAGATPSVVFDLAPWLDSSGHERIFQVRMTKIEESNHGLCGAVALLRDVTREREIDRLKDDFISTAAHELRTPITSIFGFAEFMLDQLPQLSMEELQDYLGVIHNRAEALTQIVTEMLDLSRMQSGQVIHLLRLPGDLSTLALEVVAHYRAANVGHRLSLKSSGPLPQVEYDAAKLHQVFDNLLSNAFKFSPCDSEVTIDICTGQGEVIVSVTDQGLGMTPEQVERIFDKFYRADASNTATSGLGLGMSLVKGIIEGHGGRIWVNSALGQSTTVTFALPATGFAQETGR